MKINRKLLAAFLLITLIPQAVTVAIVLPTVERSIRDQVMDQLESVATIQENRLEAIVAQNLERLALVSSRTQLRISLENHTRDPRPAYQDKMNLIIADARASITDFEDISIFMLDGTIVASTDPALMNGSEPDLEAFTRGRTEASADMLYVDEGHHLYLYLSGPLYLDDQLIGVVVIEAYANNIISLVSDHTGLGDTGETLLGQRAADGSTVFLAPTRFDEDAALDLTVPGDDERVPMNKAVDGKEVLMVNAVDYRDVEVLAVTRHIESTGWGLVVKMDKEEAFAPIADLRNILLVILAVHTVISIALSLFMARAITRPIVEMERVTREIGKGDLSKRVKVTTGDEIGDLGASFNKMVVKLKKDIARRKRVERALRTISECNQALIKAEDYDQLLNDVCRTIVDVGGYRMAWIGMAELDTERTVHPVAYAGHEEGFFERAGLSWSDDADVRCPTGRAIREGRTVMIKDVQTEPMCERLTEEVRRSGYQALISLPLKGPEGTFGALNIYSGTRNAFNQDEVSIFEEMAGDVSYGITSIRTRAEKEERERTLATMMSNLPGMAYKCQDDGDRTMEFVSEGCHELTGHMPHDLVGNKKVTYAALIHPDDRDRVLDQVRRAVARKMPFELEYRLRRADGHESWVWERGRAVTTDEGTVEAIEGIVNDITERKEAEEALKKSQESLTEAQRIAHMGNWDLDLTTNRLWWSEEIYCIFGSDPGSFEATYEAFLAMVHPDDVEYVKASVDDALQRGHRYDIMHRIVLPDGEIRHVRERAEVMSGPDGKAVRMVGTVHDITDRKRIEEALKKSEEFYEHLLMNVSDVIFMVDPGMTFINISPSIEGLLGYRREELIGRDGFGSKLLLLPLDIVERSLKGDIVDLNGGRLTHELTHKDGSKRFVEINMSVMRDHGQVIALLGVARDVTDRKRAEDLERDRARSEVYGLLASALPMFAATLPVQAKNVLISNFSKRFEDNIYPRFKEDMLGMGLDPAGFDGEAKDQETIFLAYIGWLTKMFSNFGLDPEFERKGPVTTFGFHDCPWLEGARGSPVFCLMCRSMILRSFTWTRIDGIAVQETSIAAGTRTCDFIFRFKEH